MVGNIPWKRDLSCRFVVRGISPWFVCTKSNDNNYHVWNKSVFIQMNSTLSFIFQTCSQSCLTWPPEPKSLPMQRVERRQKCFVNLWNMCGYSRLRIGTVIFVMRGVWIPPSAIQSEMPSMGATNGGRVQRWPMGINTTMWRSPWI